MVSREEIISYLNDYLQVDKQPDFGPVGLQVEGKEKVSKIVTAVSASAQLIQRAIDLAADMIILHHGLFWDRDSRVVKGSMRTRLKLLLSHDLTLLGYHLVLDKHPKLGNNVLAGQALGLHEVAALGEIGIQGRVEGISIDELQARVEKAFCHPALIFAYGPALIRTIGFCSGGGTRDLSLAVDAGLDAYITGEAKESTMHYAKESGIHFLSAGHYATEKMGIQQLGEHLQQVFPVKVEFIDIDNPV
jgi:dinuclear metal center YbgI/SA1388 family protein